MTEKFDAPVRLNERVWWLGSAVRESFLQENAWLVHDQGKSVLVDPGPMDRFEEIMKAFGAVSSLRELTAIAVTQADPDAYASLPLWEREGFTGKIIAHWKTALLMPSIGVRSVFRYIHRDETDESGLFLGLRFMPMPHLDAAGGISVFDPRTRTLFTGNLFGSFGKNAPLLGGEDSIAKVVQHHEQNILTSDSVNLALKALEPLEAALICPQHGSARKDALKELFRALRNATYGSSEIPGYDSPERKELELLRKERLRLQENIVLGQDDIMVDKLTGLYNRKYLDEFLPAFVSGNPEGAIVSLRLDGMKSYETENGEEAVNAALRVFSKIVIESRSESTLAFRDTGPSIALLFQDEEAVLPEILKLQREIAASQAFNRKMTSSGAVVFCVESTDTLILTELLRERNRALDGMGSGSICVSTEGNAPLREGSILLVEPDRALARLFADFLTALLFEVHVVGNGEEAQGAIARNPPAVVLCEERFPRSDVFALHGAFAKGTASDGRNFAVITERKNDRLIRRAYESGIRHILEKPIMLSELEYLVKALWEDSLAER